MKKNASSKPHRLFSDVDHGVKEDLRQRTALDGRGNKVLGYRRQVIHLPANCSGEKRTLQAGDWQSLPIVSINCIIKATSSALPQPWW